MNQDIIYNNWETYKNEPDYNCAKIIPDGKSKGKWIDASCKKKNTFICERMPNWNVAQVKKELNYVKKQVDDLDKQSNKTNHRIGHLENNPIPIGFIYVQLPG